MEELELLSMSETVSEPSRVAPLRSQSLVTITVLYIQCARREDARQTACNALHQRDVCPRVYSRLYIVTLHATQNRPWLEVGSDLGRYAGL